MSTWNNIDETRESVWMLFDLGALRKVGQMWVYNYNREDIDYRSCRFVSADDAKPTISSHNRHGFSRR